MNISNEIVGKRIKLIEMVDDPYPVKNGMKGIITHVDDLNQIHVKWDNGRSLAVIPEIDKFEIIN